MSEGRGLTNRQFQSVYIALPAVLSCVTPGEILARPTFSSLASNKSGQGPVED
jgi:hypothetical protein